MSVRWICIVISIFMLSTLIVSCSLENYNDEASGQRGVVEGSSSNTGENALANSPWPKFRGNARNSGLSKYDTSNNTGTLRWKFKTNDGITSSPWGMPV